MTHESNYYYAIVAQNSLPLCLVTNKYHILRKPLYGHEVCLLSLKHQDFSFWFYFMQWQFVKAIFRFWYQWMYIKTIWICSGLWEILAIILVRPWPKSIFHDKDITSLKGWITWDDDVFVIRYLFLFPKNIFLTWEWLGWR